MNRYDEIIAGFTGKQHGLVALWQTAAAGVPDHAMKARAASRTLILVFSGVYRLRGVPYTQELRWLAAVLAAGPEAWLSHRAGATFHGYDIRFPKPEITIAHARECDLGGVITHRTRRRHDVITVNGIPVTTKARTALDCAAVMAPEAFRQMIESAVTAGIVKTEALLAVLQHRGGRGVEGTLLLRDTLASGLVDEKIQRKLELLVARIIDTCRVPAPVRQHRLVCDDGREVFLDNAWPDRKKAVEAVGLRWHGDRGQFVKTRLRARSIRQSGWELDEFGWFEATEAVDEMRRSIEDFWAGSGRKGRPDPAQNEQSAA
ncbi:MAG TPA: hypothetical protein VFU93_12730 [Acidimicrobiales bacterium]|nr:hypothetical protein [Acidimicrobiales bacterium]